MFERLANGWEVAAQSWRVLKRDKQLILFPILSGVAAILVFASFALPLMFVPNLQSFVGGLIDSDQPGHSSSSGLAQFIGAAVLFTFYFVNYFVIVFFNTALAACAICRFQGGDPSVRMGLELAGKRLPQILSWSLLAASVGMLLNMIEERSEWVGRLVAGILGGLWSAATFLVVPTLAVEGLGPVDSLKRSVALIREVWGEGLAGNFNIGIVSFLLMLPAFLAIAAAFTFLPVTAAAVVGAAAVLYILGVAVVSSAVKQVFISGLYVYATEKKVPAGFSSGTMRTAFAPKR